ncbi:MAG: polymer-forming cytoskeletal protein [Roseibacillus sp.]|jgi:cytoskeletal protein CcmA (bactofilin family)
MFGRLKKTSLSCPTCGHEQHEPQFARSTFCRDRGCGAHFQIAEGMAIPVDPPSEYPFPTRGELARQRGGAKLAPARRTKKKLPPRETQLEFFSGLSRRNGNSSVVASNARIPLVATSSGDHPAIARLARLLPEDPKEGHRHLHCLDCDFPQSIPVGAFSTMCLRCTAPIPLDDYEIRKMHHRRIRTRGNVYIHRKGGINGVSVQCTDLTIEGKFTGASIDCDGDLTIARNGTITGNVRCRRLIVEGRAEVDFTHPVHAEEVIIDGIVKGNIVCERRLHLEKKSLLEGDIQTRSFSVSEGARHSGMISMPQLQERYAKFGDLSDIAGMELPGKSGEEAARETDEMAPENPFRIPPPKVPAERP